MLSPIRHPSRVSINDSGMNRYKTKGKKITRPITYSFAVPGDKSAIRRLLSDCELPTQYVHRYLKSFLVARAGKRIIGVVGVEVHGRTGLFRSLCVDEAYRGRRIATKLNEKLLSYARTMRIDRLYLFTLDAQKFASKLGFRRIDRKQISKAIRATWQFKKSYCYPSVVCMMKRIG